MSGPKKAFTLIELLVVIAIIAVLAAILIPVLGRARSQAKRVVCAANLRAIGRGLHAYSPAYGDKLPPQFYGSEVETYDTSSETLQPWRTYVAATTDYVDQQGHLIPLQLGKLFTAAVLSDPRVFYCPSGEELKSSQFSEFACSSYRHQDGKRLAGEAVWSVRPAPRESMIRTGFMYWIHGGSRLDELGASTVVTDRIHTWSTIPHTDGRGRPQGLNSLFGDGHVGFCTDSRLFDERLWGRDGGSSPGADKQKFLRVLSRINP